MYTRKECLVTGGLAGAGGARGEVAKLKYSQRVSDIISPNHLGLQEGCLHEWP
jgi:hypothetical protein